MTAKEAKEIIEDAPWENLPETDNLYEGLTILKKYNPDCPLNYSFQHDQGWFGAMDFDEYVEVMSEDDVKRMAQLGWIEDEDSWSHYS